MLNVNNEDYLEWYTDYNLKVFYVEGKQPKTLSSNIGSDCLLNKIDRKPKKKYKSSFRGETAAINHEYQSLKRTA